MMSRGVTMLKQEKLFKGLDRDTLNKPGSWVPFKPKINLATVCKNRVRMDYVKDIQCPYKDDGSGWDKDF